MFLSIQFTSSFFEDTLSWWISLSRSTLWWCLCTGTSKQPAHVTLTNVNKATTNHFVTLSFTKLDVTAFKM